MRIPPRLGRASVLAAGAWLLAVAPLVMGAAARPDEWSGPPASSADIISSNNVSTFTVMRVRSRADLGLSMGASPDPVQAGANATFTLTVTNAGPNKANSVKVTDNLPSSLSFVSCSVSAGGTCGGSGDNRTISFSSLVSGGTGTIILVVGVSPTASAGDTITNSASISSKTNDPNPGNNTATAQLTIGGGGPPDIVLILTDDQRFDAMPFLPLTDSLLGDQGVRFSNSFVPAPLCCPSRVGLLTGLYEHNHGITNNVPPKGGATLFDDSSTLATWLSGAGYATALVGKYLNDYENMTPWPYVPPGWSYWRALRIGTYWNATIVKEDRTLLTYSGKGNDSLYTTNILSRMAVSFIENADPGRPFLLLFAPFAPHDPATPALADLGSFAAQPPLRLPSYNEADVSDKPLWIRNLPLMTAADSDSTDALYHKQLESLQSADRAVRDIVDALERTGRLSNTVLMFTSDNGLAMGEHRWVAKKDCVYEECIKVPLLVRAPGVAPRDDAHLISNLDLTATILDYAGAPAPHPLNGVSLRPLLADPAAPWRDALLTEVLGESSPRNEQSVRTVRYVYAEYQNGDRELYDLEADPFELENKVVDPAYASVVADLQSRLDALRSE